MKIEVVLKRRDGKANAKGVFEDGKLTVKKGSHININGINELALSGFMQKTRSDKSLVGNDGVLLRDVSFKSASTAGTFVTGTSTNGMIAWRTLDGVKLADRIKR